jgi:ribose-phosphate pyrophosphokinase
MSLVVIQSLPPGLTDARRLASRLGIEAHEIVVHRFPDGELRVTVGPVAPVTIVYGSLDQPNDKIIGLLLACEALRRNGAPRLVLVAPYMCYMRQDAAFQANEAVSQKAIGRLLAASFDRIVTVDAHLHRTHDIQSVFPGAEASNLSASTAIAAHLRSKGFDSKTVVVGPDEESREWIGDLAGQLGLAHQVGQKIRHGDRQVETRLSNPAAIAGRPALLVDDIVSSGGTLTVCAGALLAAGATFVDVIVTHALFPPDALSAFKSAGVRSILSTDSVPHPTNAIPLDGILAEALHGEGMGIGSARAPSHR